MTDMIHSVKIAGTGSYVPERIVTNLELIGQAKTTCEWIEENLGIYERRIAANGELTSDLATKAGMRAIQSAGLTKDDIDLIIVATATPDRSSPSTACLVHEKLQMQNHCPAFDVNAVCSGFLYAMCTASQFVKTGIYENILVIGADTFSNITDFTRRDCVFFGDGAGAIILQRSNLPEALFTFDLHANGAGKDNFTVFPDDKFFTMNGRAVYDTGTTVLPSAILNILKKNNFLTTDITCVIPHQPSIRVLKRTAEILDIPFERIKRNMHRYANTAGATVPILLDEVVRAKEIQKGDLVVFAAVGSGWTWGSALYRWQ